MARIATPAISETALRFISNLGFAGAISGYPFYQDFLANASPRIAVRLLLLTSPWGNYKRASTPAKPFAEKAPFADSTEEALEGEQGLI